MENCKINTSIELTELNKMIISVEKQNDDDKYAYYVYKDDKVIEKIKYTSENKNIYWVTEPGKYKVKVFVKDKSGEKVSQFTDEIYFEGLKTVICSTSDKKYKFTLFKNVYTIIYEIYTNFMRMVRLSLFDYYLTNKDSYLGRIWNVLNPMIQIATYWFVFGIGIRSNSPVGEHAFLPWMLCGLIPWFFFSQSIVGGASSIYAKSGTVLKLKYPVSTVPIGSILVRFYNHLAVLVILIIMMLCFGYYPNFFWLNIVYYFIFELVFLSGFAMITSVLTMIARDFQKLLASIIRLWFYMTPILWDMSNLPDWIKNILAMNPALYIVNGFRDSLLDNVMFYTRTKEMAFFWVVNVIVLIIGCNLQIKFRDRFIDML